MAEPDSTAHPFERLREERKQFQQALLAPNTRRGYRYDFDAFKRWCEGMRVEFLPATPETLSLYVTDLLTKGRKVSTVARYVASVNAEHRRLGLARPVTLEVRRLLLGARRLRPEAIRQVTPLTLEDDTPLAARDRALLLVGFASALRSASLAALLLSDVELVDRGAVLSIRREKQDQAGKGRFIGLPRAEAAALCPVVSLCEWLQRRGKFGGPLFARFDHQRGWRGRHLEPERIGQIVQYCAARIGLDPKLYGGHSLRSGFVTEAGERGISETLIASQTGHRDMGTLRRYFRRSDVWKSNAAGAIGL